MPLLAEFRRWSGAGELYSARARGGSAPQTNWMVGRKRDCLTVAKLLARCPPLGKAARQFDHWLRAVEIWVNAGGSSPALAVLAKQLRELHRSAEPIPCLVDINEWDLEPFLAGFASAEAHFGATELGSPVFTINVRADDGPLLSLFRHAFEIGYLREVAAASSSRPAVSWRIGRLHDLRQLVSIFDRHPPRGRAADVYAAWRELVVLETRTPTVRRGLSTEIRRRRRYRPGYEQVARMPQRERSRQRVEDALMRWSCSGDYPGSACDYERWRRRSTDDAPTRNTVAAVYGSWLQALQATGLDTRFAMAEKRVATLRAGSVRWRAARVPESPSQMTVYRRFPGGFAEVLAAAREAEPGNEAA